MFSPTILAIPGIRFGTCAKLIEGVSDEFPAFENVHIVLHTKSAALERNESFDLQEWQREIESPDPQYRVVFLS
jgi:hypothetical protein